LASRFVAVVPRTERKNCRSASFARLRSVGGGDGGAAGSFFPGLEDCAYRRGGWGHVGEDIDEFLAVSVPCVSK
jgi:hypothetical protein